MTHYRVAERFKSIQGEGLYAGTPMAFIRFVGCSVGKKVCHHCDTDFERILPWRGGGEYAALPLFEWAKPLSHVCLTGGEPLDQDLTDLVFGSEPNFQLHLETSGTTLLPLTFRSKIWVTVSPKPGYLTEMIVLADEVKVIVPGLGSGEGWPTLYEALDWARAGKRVYLQPRNAKFDVDRQNLLYCLDIIREHPELRLSVQMHKMLKVQ